MREYAQVAPTFWIGDTGKQIRKCGPEAQLLALYLITSPHANMFGLYYLPMSLVTHETGLSAARVKLCMAKLSAVNFAQYDAPSEFVWVVEMTAYQVGNLAAGDNRLKGLRRAYEGLPNNPFIGQFFEKYGIKYGLERRASRGLTGGTQTPQIIEQETETETDVGFSFEDIWAKYPNKDGKKEAERHFNGSVKSPQDFEDISVALENYLGSEKVKKGYVKNGSTWFNNWRDWVTAPIANRPKSQSELLIERDEAERKAANV